MVVCFEHKNSPLKSQFSVELLPALLYLVSLDPFEISQGSYLFLAICVSVVLQDKDVLFLLSICHFLFLVHVPVNVKIIHLTKQYLAQLKHSAF